MSALSMPKLVCALVGPTASGKSALALSLAKRNGFALLNADSRQMVQGMRIGTAAPSDEDMSQVPHFLYGVIPPDQPLSPQLYRERALQAIAASDRPLIAVGGSGLYLKELLQPSEGDRGEVPSEYRSQVEDRMAREGSAAIHAWLMQYDPQSTASVHPADRYRLTKRLEHYLWRGQSYVRAPPARDPQFQDTRIWHVTRPREEIHSRIAARLEIMWAQGWCDEVAALQKSWPALWKSGQGPVSLHAQGPNPTLATAQPATSGQVIAANPDSAAAQEHAQSSGPSSVFTAVGYREIAEALEHNLPEDEVKARILARTRQYAKKQIAFFKSQIDGVQAIPIHDLEALAQEVDWQWEALLSRLERPSL